ncbi:MAG: hypothetical protein ABI972_24340 [Acidobacteriota bacterium]
MSSEFYSTTATPPSRSELVAAVRSDDFARLDQLYFAWEDQLKQLSPEGASDFGLLSGYAFRQYRSLSLHEAAEVAKSGTVYTEFFVQRVLPRLIATRPQLVGITIASQEQMIPAVELMHHIRRLLPETFLILGGNVVTRLRGTDAFETLTSLVDVTVLFQGELGFATTLHAISELGVAGARRALPRVLGNEQVPYDRWPVPSFAGIDFARLVGIPVLPYVSTRGCYWGKCSFCAIPAGWSETGYGGSAPADFVAGQLLEMRQNTGIPRVKFVDEAFPPAKVRPLADFLMRQDVTIEWEAYARLEPSWEDLGLLESARAGGLRKLYFGLEQAPSASRAVFGKNDRGNPTRILAMCDRAGIKVHLFCMVGHPGTSKADAHSTVQFLLDNQHLINAADVVGFRLDRGTTVSGVRPVHRNAQDWAMGSQYEPTDAGSLSPEEVADLEGHCQETIWESCPRLLHPLYRIVGNWETVEPAIEPGPPSEIRPPCPPNLHSMA